MITRRITRRMNNNDNTNDDNNDKQKTFAFSKKHSFLIVFFFYIAQAS